MQAALWAPRMAERDIILEALAELPDPSETAPTRWQGQEAPELSPTQPVVRRSKTGQTFHRRSGELQAQSCECSEKQRHSTHPTILIYDPSHCNFPSKPGDPLPQQCNIAAWASPLHLWVRAACTTGTKLRTELQREDEQKWEWMIPKKEAAQSAGSSDTRPDQEAASNIAAKSARSDADK